MSQIEQRRFVELVKLMRESQKRYFATRNSAALIQSKELERKVDANIVGLIAGAGLFENAR